MDDSITVKIVLLGASSVGKTCLLRRYTEGIFEDTAQATVGVSFSTRAIKMDGKRVVLNIWDTAGKERFSALSKMYYRNADIAIVCYDLTDLSSFRRISFWVEEVNNHVYKQACKVYLCGTKKDLVDERGEREISEEALNGLITSYAAKAIETSSKTGENIETLFELIVTDILDSDFYSSVMSADSDVIDIDRRTEGRRCCTR